MNNRMPEGHSCNRAARRHGRHRGSRNASCPTVRICENVVSHRKSSRAHTTRRRTLHSGGPARPYVSAGLTFVGASALVGSFIAPTSPAVDVTRVQLAAVQHDAPAPNQLLGGLPAGGGLATDTTTTRVQCSGDETSTDLLARIGDVASGVRGRFVGPEAFVAVGSDVVSHIITTPK